MTNKNATNMILALSFAVLFAGCTTTPTIDTAPDAELSYDGLYLVEHTRVDRAWARKDIDLSSHQKIMLQSAGIHYRPVKEVSAYAASRGGKSEFPVPEQKKQELKEVLREGFLGELRKTERFEFVTEPGPDVLIVRGAQLDVLSHMPPERPGRTDVYLSSVGAATLVIELIDCQSEAVLVRTLDRRAAETVGGDNCEKVWSSSLTNTAKRAPSYGASHWRTRPIAPATRCPKHTFARSGSPISTPNLS